MVNEIKVGDIVQSLSGRDKGGYFLVVDITGKFCFITDGKIRKVTAIKKKNFKHLKVVYVNADDSLAEQIKIGVPTDNKKVRKLIKEKVKKED